METTQKSFDAVEYFRALKKDLSGRLANLTLEQQKEFLKMVLTGKIELN